MAWKDMFWVKYILANIGKTKTGPIGECFQPLELPETQLEILPITKHADQSYS